MSGRVCYPRVCVCVCVCAGVAGNTLDTETLGRVYTLLARAPPLPRGRFDALIGDLSAVIRGEAQSDVLMAYEM